MNFPFLTPSVKKGDKVFLRNFERKGVHWVMPGGCFVEKSKQSDWYYDQRLRKTLLHKYRSYMDHTGICITSTLAKENKTIKFVLLKKQLRSQKGFLSSEILENFLVLIRRPNHINDREKLNWITEPITYLICFLRTINFKKNCF